MAVQIQIRRDLAAHWISANPTLAEGEAGYETDTGKIKYGDGTTAWNSLAYYGVSQLNAYLQVANAVSTFQTKSIERAALANTNTFIATKVNTTTFNSALANTNLAITNVKTGLTTTNTALRLLISDRLQVANASSIYQTKVIERAALANTNLAITNVKTGLTTTNTAIRLLVSDTLQVANAASIYQTKVIERAALANTNTFIATKLSSSNPATSGLLAHTGRATISTNLTVSGNTSITGITTLGAGAILNTPASGNLSTCTADGTDQVGFKNIPQNSQIAAYTCVLDDSGKHIFHPSSDENARTFTIPANSSVAYPIGTALTFVNMTAAVVTIAITTDTMYLSSAGTTGSRSLAQYGSATALKLTTTTWLISGSGIT